MSLNFPDAPSLGTIYGSYIWDGEKWDYSGHGSPGTANIKMSDTPPEGAIPGDLWLETDSGFVFVLIDDGSSLQWVVTNPVVPAAGPQGIQGIQGIPGNTILYGGSNPTAGQGVDGNFFINTTTHFYFGPKAAGAWPAGTSLIGPQGIQGIQGIQGVPGDLTQAMADLRYLKLVGGTMTGDVTINKGNAAIVLNQNFASDDTNFSQIRFNMGGAQRWQISGAWGTEDTGNVGSNWSLDRFNNSGVYIDSPITVRRSDGRASFSANGSFAGSLSVNGGLHGWMLTVRTGTNANLGMFDGGAGIANFGCINDVGDQWMTVNLISKITVANTFTPVSNAGANLGTAALRFATVYTSDLSLSNGIGDWTIVEGEDDLFLYNNKRGKVYKFALIEVDPSAAPPKME